MAQKKKLKENGRIVRPSCQGRWCYVYEQTNEDGTVERRESHEILRCPAFRPN